MASLLCVDDESVVLHKTKSILQRAGHIVFTASTVADAFSLIKTHHFDLLLLDCVPDRGWLTLEAKRINPSIRVALCTGDTDGGDLPLVDAVFHKLVSPPVLLQKISELLPASPAA